MVAVFIFLGLVILAMRELKLSHVTSCLPLWTMLKNILFFFDLDMKLVVLSMPGESEMV